MFTKKNVSRLKSEQFFLIWDTVVTVQLKYQFNQALMIKTHIEHQKQYVNLTKKTKKKTKKTKSKTISVSPILSNKFCSFFTNNHGH